MPRTSQEDPLKACQFIVEMGGARYGFKEVSGLKMTVESTEYREGGDNTTPRKSPGLAKFDNITLKRGVILDEGQNDFYGWAKQVHDVVSKGRAAIDFRRDIDIVVLDRAGEEALRFRVYECWPIEFEALPMLSGTSSDDVIETLTLCNEGWDKV